MEKKKVSLLPLLPPPPPYSVSSSLWLTYKIGMGRWWWLHSCSRQRQVKISAVRTRLGQFGHRTSTRRSSVPANPLKSSWWWSACWSAVPHSGDCPGTPTTTKTLYSPRTCSASPTPHHAARRLRIPLRKTGCRQSMLPHPLHHDLSSISPGSPSSSAVSLTRYNPGFSKGRESFWISEFSSEFCIALVISICRTFSELHSVTLIISSSNPHQVFMDGLKICFSRNCVGWNVAMKKLVIETRKLLLPTWLQLFCFDRSCCILCLPDRAWCDNDYCDHIGSIAPHLLLCFT